MKQKFVLELQHKIHVNGIQPQEESMVSNLFIGKLLAKSCKAVDVFLISIVY